MTAEVYKEYIIQILPTATFDESGEWLVVLIDAGDWKPLAHALRDGEHNFNFLFCVTCIDWKTHLTMVYHLSSTGHRQTIVVKANLDSANPEIDSVAGTWRTAEFHEREQYDLFGVKFRHHPDLRRLVLTDDFVGHPLRKDFDDPVNMVKL